MNTNKLDLVKKQISEKYGIEESAILDVVTLMVSAGFEVLSGDGVDRNETPFESVCASIKNMARSGKKECNVSYLRNTVKAKTAFKGFGRGLTRFLRNSLPKLESNGLISNISGDSFTINKLNK